MPVVMKELGHASGAPSRTFGWYLKEFEHEAHNGRGLITMTPHIAEAKRFADLAEQWEFWRHSPECRPIREDGKPNRPLTASNWEIVTVPE